MSDKRTREQAALLCAVMASNGLPPMIGLAAYHLGFDSLKVHRLADAAYWRVRPTYRARPRREVWAEVWAEAEALIRCGWVP